MPKRLARNPSTASLTPAARNNTKAIHIAPDEIAQTTTGTRRMRPSVMRFGMLKGRPGLTARPYPRPADRAEFPPEYSRRRTIARLAILSYDPLAIEGGDGEIRARDDLRAGGRRLRRRQAHGRPDQA